MFTIHILLYISSYSLKSQYRVNGVNCGLSIIFTFQHPFSTSSKGSTDPTFLINSTITQEMTITFLKRLV